MKKTHIILVAIFFIATSCSSVRVTTDLDKATDFSQYKTASFLGWQEDIDKLLNEFDKERVQKALEAEMDKRNINIVDENGDMVVSVFLVVDQKTSTTAYTSHFGGAGYGYGGFRGGWGMGSSSTTFTESDYLQGTMVVDVFDQQSKGLIWEGVGVGTIHEKPEKREKRVPKTIAAIFKDFPIPPVEE